MSTRNNQTKFQDEWTHEELYLLQLLFQTCSETARKYKQQIKAILSQ